MHSKFGSVLLAGAITLAIIAVSSAAAQNAPTPGQRAMPGAPESGALSVAITYNGTLSGVVTSSRFWMQGGSVQLHGRFYGGWGAVADIAGAHTANMGSGHVGLGLVTATFGPRYTWSPAHARYSFFAQGLVGEAFGFDSLFPNSAGVQTDATSLALQGGGGLNYQFRPHLAFRAFEADYIRTRLPNSTNNVQNNLRLGAGLVLRFK